LITSDIAVALRTPQRRTSGLTVMPKQMLADPSRVEVTGLGDRSPRMLDRQRWRRRDRANVEKFYARAAGVAQIRFQNARIVLTENAV
jgi:hypothetical protein